MCGCEPHRNYVCGYHRSPAARRNALRAALRAALLAELAPYATAGGTDHTDPAN